MESGTASALSSQNPLNRFPEDIHDKLKLSHAKWKHDDRLPTLAELDQMSGKVALGFRKGAPMLVYKAEVEDESGKITNTVTSLAFVDGKSPTSELGSGADVVNQQYEAVRLAPKNAQ